MINIRAKGAEGEREVARALNQVVEEILTAYRWDEEIIAGARRCIQRNQNQSAVGGNDLSNVFGLSIEVKRQEELSVESWWCQCVSSAMRNNEFPVLIYRKNHQKWNVVLYVSVPLPELIRSTPEQRYGSLSVRSTISWGDFLKWFRSWVERKLANGEYPRT
jgi:hypothetical protein